MRLHCQLNSIEWTDEYVAAILQALETANGRAGIKSSTSSLANYIDNIHKATYLNMNTLKYSGFDGDWIIIPTSQRDSTLQRLQASAPGLTGRDKLFSYVLKEQRIIGISRRYIQDWLNRERKPKTHVLHPGVVRIDIYYLCIFLQLLLKQYTTYKKSRHILRREEQQQ